MSNFLTLVKFFNLYLLSINVNTIGLVMNNISYVGKASYNISMKDLTEKQNIEEFKIEITKTIINLTKNHIKYHIKEFCNCEEFDRTMRLLINIKTFLESL